MDKKAANKVIGKKAIKMKPRTTMSFHDQPHGPIDTLNYFGDVAEDATIDVSRQINHEFVRVPTWVWVPIAIYFFVRALAIAQQIVAVATPIGGVG